jgi:hypothetical protein
MVDIEQKKEKKKENTWKESVRFCAYINPIIE